jgi:hypothetical protein
MEMTIKAAAAAALMVAAAAGTSAGKCIVLHLIVAMLSQSGV